MSLAALAFISFMGLGVKALGLASQYNQQTEANNLQRDSLDLQQQSFNESMRSNYYSYMQQLESMRNEQAQDLLAINQQRENIASNQNYLDRWASEYDMSMQNGIDESFNQYQQLASNYSSSLVSNAETGRRGGSAGRLAGDSGMALASMNGGSTNGFNLTGSRLGSYLQSSAIDMMADRQTALSSLGTSYKAIDSYQNAIGTLQGSIDSMENTTGQMADELKKKNIEV